MLSKFNFVIPLPPISKKNSSQIIRIKGRPMIIPSKQYKEYEKKCALYFGDLSEKDFPIDYPVIVKCTFYMPTRRRVDGVNLEESVYDILVKYGVLTDDNRDIVVGGDGTRVMYDKQNPRTEITIIQVEGYEQWAKK